MADRDEGTNPDDAVPEEPHRAMDEEELWAKLVAAYDEEPGPGAEPWPEAENLPAPTVETAAAKEDRGAAEGADVGEGTDGDGADDEADPPSPAPPPATTSVVIHSVMQGPRDYHLPDDDDEGHFEPPEPPPLPETDVTTKFAWLAVLGGPLLVFAFILLQQELPWWAVAVGIGGFLGGFATLVARMRPGGDEDDDDLPGGGAVV
jgi:hypothetical protein